MYIVKSFVYEIVLFLKTKNVTILNILFKSKSMTSEVVILKIIIKKSDVRFLL